MPYFPFVLKKKIIYKNPSPQRLMPVLLHMWRHLSLGKQGLIETGSGTECAVSGTPLTFHPPLEVMQRWPDSSQTRGDESDWALIQYPVCWRGHGWTRLLRISCQFRLQAWIDENPLKNTTENNWNTSTFWSHCGLKCILFVAKCFI